MKLTILSFISLFLLMIGSINGYNNHFISNREGLNLYGNFINVVLISSPGRSGSTLLTEALTKYATRFKVFKSHLLPPNSRFKGKCIFIFSNPDQAAESCLYRILHGHDFGEEHFANVETADRQWLKKIGGPFNQTERDNLLSYDALGTLKQLKEWLLIRTEPAELNEANILAIKYENLWDPATKEAIKGFLHISRFKLPPQEERKHNQDLLPQEIAFRNIYNLGTKDDPHYKAYNQARALWEAAPPIQYLKLRKN